MLGLTLREEFRGKRLKGTAIEFNEEIEKDPTDFLEITYPTSDLIKLLKAVEIGQDRPVVLIGERGQGKSHLMVTLYHLFKNTEKSRQWLENWSQRLDNTEDFNINIRPNMTVIAESLQRQNYKFLWDILLDRHPLGEYIRGKWEGMGEKKTDILGEDLLLEMFRKQPTILILDEFQTWYDGLTNTKQFPWKNWAFNFIQILSEISKEHPELLALVVSVRNGNTEAFQQIHRINPILVDFKGDASNRDRKRLLIHRLFENRRQVPNSKILDSISVHINEYFRLTNTIDLERDKLINDFVETWPFAPHLMKLLEDQVLIATDAQETRDLIKILANLYKKHGEDTVIITAAHFTVTDDKSGVADLLDSVANQDNVHLKEKAVRNLEAVFDAIKKPSYEVPHANEIVSALWLRSLSVDRLQGAEPNVLQIDITQDKSIDDNSFQVELQTIVNNSFNIHQVSTRLVFKNEENPKSKLMAFARNDKLFSNGQDIEQLAKEIKYTLAGQGGTINNYNLIILKKNWLDNPWAELDEKCHPLEWDERIPVIAIPTYEENMNKILGKWIKENIPEKRNTVRFLLPRENIYYDRELIVLARAILKSFEWQTNEPEYSKLYKDFQKELRDKLNTLFDRYAVLEQWNYLKPEQCKFIIEQHGAQGSSILSKVNDIITQNIFVPEDFEEIVMEFAERSESIGKLLRELKEPRANENQCIPWLGEASIKDKLLRLCSNGDIGINLRGIEYLVKQPTETGDEAWQRMKGKLGVGKHLDESIIMLPDTIPSAGGQVKPNLGSAGIVLEDRGKVIDTVGAEVSNDVLDTHEVNNDSYRDIFSHNEDNRQVVRKSHCGGPTSSLNLLGRIEQWGIGPATKVDKVKVSIENMTGAQLQALLKGLPDGVTYNLELEKEE